MHRGVRRSQSGGTREGKVKRSSSATSSKSGTTPSAPPPSHQFGRSNTSSHNMDMALSSQHETGSTSSVISATHSNSTRGERSGTRQTFLGATTAAKGTLPPTHRMRSSNTRCMKCRNIVCTCLENAAPVPPVKRRVFDPNSHLYATSSSSTKGGSSTRRHEAHSDAASIAAAQELLALRTPYQTAKRVRMFKTTVLREAKVRGHIEAVEEGGFDNLVVMCALGPDGLIEMILSKDRRSTFDINDELGGLGNRGLSSSSTLNGDESLSEFDPTDMDDRMSHLSMDEDHVPTIRQFEAEAEDHRRRQREAIKMKIKAKQDRQLQQKSAAGGGAAAPPAASLLTAKNVRQLNAASPPKGNEGIAAGVVLPIPGHAMDMILSPSPHLPRQQSAGSTVLSPLTPNNNLSRFSSAKGSAPPQSPQQTLVMDAGGSRPKPDQPTPTFSPPNTHAHPTTTSAVDDSLDQITPIPPRAVGEGDIAVLSASPVPMEVSPSSPPGDHGSSGDADENVVEERRDIDSNSSSLEETFYVEEGDETFMIRQDEEGEEEEEEGVDPIEQPQIDTRNTVQSATKRGVLVGAPREERRRTVEVEEASSSSSPLQKQVTQDTPNIAQSTTKREVVVGAPRERMEASPQKQVTQEKKSEADLEMMHRLRMLEQHVSDLSNDNRLLLMTLASSQREVSRLDEKVAVVGKRQELSPAAAAPVAEVVAASRPPSQPFQAEGGVEGGVTPPAATTWDGRPRTVAETQSLTNSGLNAPVAGGGGGGGILMIPDEPEEEDLEHVAGAELPPLHPVLVHRITHSIDQWRNPFRTLVTDWVGEANTELPQTSGVARNVYNVVTKGWTTCCSRPAPDDEDEDNLPAIDGPPSSPRQIAGPVPPSSTAGAGGSSMA